MQLNTLETPRLRIRPFAETDLDSCLRFRREVFALDEKRATTQRWLTWTIDSYRELAQLAQPPYADYAVALKDCGEFLGSVGIVPTVLPWGALRGDLMTPAQPGDRLFWASCPPIADAALRPKRLKQSSVFSLIACGRGVPWRRPSATTSPRRL